MAIAQGTMKLVRELVLDVSECITCGVVYGVSLEFEKARRGDGKTFYCPNGHSMTYGETDLTRAQKKAARLERDLASAQDSIASWRTRLAREEASKAAIKGHLTRARKRIQAGLCPECNVQFPDLEIHMQSAHYGAEVQEIEAE